jgi:biopolymer transport protein TolQ
MNPADVAQSVLPLTSSDLSLFTLFWNAHWVVKTVMVGLLICSVWVWAIAIDKTVLYARTRRAMDRFEQAFWSGQSLDELYRALSSRPAHSMAALFVAAMREWKRSFEGSARTIGGLQMRIEKVMEVTIAREVERLEKRLLVLATVGSAGPFVGLFGTVWGIMTSFQSIAASKNTSLAVVAPGIAEALASPASCDERNQRDADGRRDAGVVDHLHGVGAVAHGWCADRPPAKPGQKPRSGQGAAHRLRQRQGSDFSAK